MYNLLCGIFAWSILFSESRYLLILTENYAALKILQQQLTRLKDAIYIFGSSFPKDQEYTQVGCLAYQNVGDKVFSQLQCKGQDTEPIIF